LGEIKNDGAMFVFAEVIRDLNCSEWAARTGEVWSSRDPRLRAQLDVLSSHLKKGQVLLDVGTGPGIIPEVFHRLGCKVISIDFPKTGGTLALSRLVNKGILGHYAEVGVDRLPLADGEVDVAFVGDVIEHLPHSPKAFMSEVVRVVKCGGLVLITTPNAVRLEMRLKMMVGGSFWPKLSTYFHEEINNHHHKEYTRQELDNLLEWSGLAVVERRYHDWRYKTTLKRATHTTLVPVLALRPAWKSGLLAVGRKPGSDSQE
jgi:2-polyprenyl-3-methyl-5-hydroxy-6-metoxy-1,4-benzoquinol methylase